MYRGYDESLVKRVCNARYGGRFYLEEDTIKFFNSYAGKTLHVSEDMYVFVESIKHEAMPREYRVVEVIFSGEPHRETVTVLRSANCETAREAVHVYIRDGVL